MYYVIRKLLFLFPAEFTHNFSLRFLKFIYHLGLLPNKHPIKQPVKVMGLTFPNRIGLAAGLDRNGTYIDTLACFGFGFIEIGTITPHPQVGNAKPRLFRLLSNEAFINRLGFANKGLDFTISQLKKMQYKGILGINIGKNPQTPVTDAALDYLHCFTALWPYASYIAINISSPNSKGLRDLQQITHLTTLLQALKNLQAQIHKQHKKYVPLVVKIAPDLSEVEIKDIAHVLLAQNIDGVIATNTTVQRPSISNRLAQEAGGLSGQPLHNLSLAVIKELQTHLKNKIPIIACGGNMDGHTGQAKLNAGATLIQIYSGFIYHGPGLIDKLVSVIPRNLAARGMTD